MDHLAERVVPVLTLMKMMEMQPEQALPELERPPVQEEEACSSSKKNKAKKQSFQGPVRRSERLRLLR